MRTKYSAVKLSWIFLGAHWISMGLLEISRKTLTGMKYGSFVSSNMLCLWYHLTVYRYNEPGGFAISDICLKLILNSNLDKPCSFIISMSVVKLFWFFFSEVMGQWDIRIFEIKLSFWKMSYIATIPWTQLYHLLENIDGLVQDCSITSASAMEILQSCTKPLILCSDDEIGEGKAVVFNLMPWCTKFHLLLPVGASFYYQRWTGPAFNSGT